MANNIFQTWKQSQRYLHSPDGIFYLQQRRRLLAVEAFTPYFSAPSLFALLQAVVILKGLLQKEKIDTYLRQQGLLSIQNHGRIKHHLIRDRFAEDMRLAYAFEDENHQRIILPFFNRTLNYIYAVEPDKLYDYPYSRLEEDFSTSIIDAFEHYGWQVYASNFLSLIPLNPHDRTTKAFYEPHTHTILFINNQGRLDGSISLFDRGLKHPNLTQIPERLNRAIHPYFSMDREGLIRNLHQEGFFSQRHLNVLLNSKSRRLIHRGKE